MFPLFGFLSGARNILLNNKKELFGFIKTTFIEHLKTLDENDQRSFIDSFLVRQAEVRKCFMPGIPMVGGASHSLSLVVFLQLFHYPN